jgi:hypothetical protein
MLSFLMNKMRGGGPAYSFRPGIPSGIGVGVEGLGFMPPHSLPLDGPYDKRRTIHATIAPLEGGVMKMLQDVTNVSLVGNGAYTTGALSLQALAQFQAGQSGS